MRRAHPFHALLFAGFLAAGLALPSVPGRAAPGRAPVPADAGAPRPVPGVLIVRVDAARTAALRADARRAPGIGGTVRTTDPALAPAFARLGVTGWEPLFAGRTDPRDALSRWFRVRLDPSFPLAGARALLESAAGVEAVGEDAILPLDAGIPDDYYFRHPLPSVRQWNLLNPSGLDVAALEGWNLAVGDTGVLLAIVDSGVDYEHPDLGGVNPYTAGSIHTNWVEYFGAAGVDDDGNGFVDDVRGWDFVDAVPGAEFWPGEDGVAPDNDPRDFDGHGTHVAGIAAAIADNAIGVAGASRGCRILPVRAGGTFKLGEDRFPGVYMSFCASAILYAVDNGAEVINCSWGSGYLEALAAAVDTAVARGVLLVVAAGNENTQSQERNWLSTTGKTVDVAAVGPTGVKVPFSNYGTWVDVVAPGAAITSTFYQGDLGIHEYRLLEGTSQAAPIVTALAGLLLSADPSLTRDEVKDRILGGAVRVDSLNAGFLAGRLGSGLVNYFRSLAVGSGAWEVRAGAPLRASPLSSPGGADPATLVSGSGGVSRRVRAADGVAVPGWPKPGLGDLFPSPASGDLLGNGGEAFVQASREGSVRAWDGGGNLLPGWPQSIAGAIYATPALADLDGAPGLEIVVGATDSTLTVFRADGTRLPGFPRRLSGPIVGSPAVADVDGEPGLEIAVPTLAGMVHLLHPDGSELADWPVPVGAPVSASPIVVDLLGDGRTAVILGDRAGYLHQLLAEGRERTGFPKHLGGELFSSPAAGDVGVTEGMEIVVGSGDGKVHVVNAAGNEVPGWPVALGGAIHSSPVVGDLDGDGAPDLAVGGADSLLHGLRGDGTPVPGFPLAARAAFHGGATIGDLLGDGTLAVAAGDDAGVLHFWRLGTPAPEAAFPWPTFRGGARRTGGLPPGPGAAVRGAGTARRALPLTLSPNPARGTSATLSFTLPAPALRATVRLFDVGGRLVADLGDGPRAAGETRIALHAGPHAPAGGVYFVEVRARLEDGTALRSTAKWIRLERD